MNNDDEYSVEKYSEMLESTPKYSLSVDPENKYDMTEAQKKFIKFYIDTKNINFAAELAGITSEEALAYFASYSSQQEIRRINLALFHRQFNAKMLTLDQIGAYLTSLLSGVNVPLADQLKSSDKLKVVDLLIKLNELKDRALNDPSVVAFSDIDTQIKDLSLTTIKQLLANTKKKNTDELVFTGTLTPEEYAYLKTLPSKDILALVEQYNSNKLTDKED